MKDIDNIILDLDGTVYVDNKIINKSDITAINKVLTSDYLTQGPRKKEFEEKFIGVVNVPNARDIYAVYFDKDAFCMFSESVSESTRKTLINITSLLSLKNPVVFHSLTCLYSLIIFC